MKLLSLLALFFAALMGAAREVNVPIISGGTVYELSKSGGVEMKLTGSTPFSHWTLTAHRLSAQSEMDVSSDRRIRSIEALSFTLPVHNLKGNNSGMEQDAYDALKAARYPNIVFRMASANIQSRGDHQFVQAIGTLSIAGVTKPIMLQMDVATSDDGSVTFHGSQEMKMSDYGVTRPTILGIFKAGDAMALDYQLTFVKTSNFTNEGNTR